MSENISTGSIVGDHKDAGAVLKTVEQADEVRVLQLTPNFDLARQELVEIVTRRLVPIHDFHCNSASTTIFIC